ncbi:hypothetical protein OG900_33180 [Streptomyces sp. NBC_00433]
MNRFRESAAYRRLVEATPGIDVLDDVLAVAKARRIDRRERREADRAAFRAARRTS